MPDSSDNYQLPSWPPTAINRDLWNAVMGSIGDRLRAREELEADFEALIAQGTQASLDYIQATVAPQIASLQTSIELAQEQIDQIIVDGIAPNAAKLGGQLPAYYAPASALPLKANVTYVDSELLALATAIQLLLDQKAGATETANELSKRTRVDAAQSFTLAERGQARANIGGGVLAGFRNKIINGDFAISQRGASFNIAPGATAYTADRWVITNGTNQTLTVQAPNVAPAFDRAAHPRLRLAFTTAPTTGEVIVAQRIEDAETLAGQSATASWWIAAGEAIAGSMGLNQNFGVGGSATVSQTQGIAVASGGAFAKQSKVFSLAATTGKTLGTGNHVAAFITLPIRSTNPVSITRVSLVEGDATAEDDPFSPRHPQQEFALCQRYFQYLSGLSIYVGTGNAANGFWQEFVIPAMRTAPSSVLGAPSYVNSSSLLSDNTSPFKFRARATITAGGAAAYVTFNISLDAEL